jgi:hypothetical protein
VEGNPSLSTSLLLHPGDAYRQHGWEDGGRVHAAVRFQGGGASSGTIQGPPAAVRELATALVPAADHADAIFGADQTGQAAR